MFVFVVDFFRETDILIFSTTFIMSIYISLLLCQSNLLCIVTKVYTMKRVCRQLKPFYLSLDQVEKPPLEKSKPLRPYFFLREKSKQKNLPSATSAKGGLLSWLV